MNLPHHDLPPLSGQVARTPKSSGPLTIDLNADLGEGMPFDIELLQVVTSANVCCGAYVGSASLTFATVAAAAALGVAVGAHLGYADRESFGRRSPTVSPPQLLASLRAQVELLLAAAKAAGTRLAYVKPHGALYHDSRIEGFVTDVLWIVLREYNLPLLHQAPSILLDRAEAAGLPAFREGFLDRGYDANGQLIARGLPGAVLEDARTLDGQLDRLFQSHSNQRFDSLCLHGDTPAALALATQACELLQTRGITRRAFLPSSITRPADLRDD